MKNLIKRYLNFMWHYSQAYSLITIPLNGIGIAVNIFTFLAIAFGLKFAWWGYVIFFGCDLILVGFVGILIVKTGLTAYYQSLNNSQSPELLTILEKVERIERKLA